jgi:hypothetical protein
MKPTFNISPDEKKPELYNAKIRPQYCMPILLRPDGAFRFIPAASEKSGALRKPSAWEACTLPTELRPPSGSYCKRTSILILFNLSSAIISQARKFHCFFIAC